MLIEGLTKYHNCEVYIVTVVDGLGTSSVPLETLENADVIWAPYEPLIPHALHFREKFGIPVVGHFEVVLEERLTNPQYRELYTEYAKDWLLCDKKTVVGETHFSRIKELLNNEVDRADVSVKYYPVDTEMLEANRVEVEEKKQVISCMRLVPHKKHLEIIKAIAASKTKPVYVIVGKGPEAESIRNTAEELGVTVVMKGLVSDKQKHALIQESMFCIHPWAWLPVGEAAYYKKASVAYYNDDTIERLGAMPVYVRPSDTKMLAEAIDLLSSDKKMRVRAGEKAFSILNNGDCFSLPLIHASKKLLTVLLSTRGNVR
jgi:glycosyltransferase involved in cell wall biosynthesis